MAWNIEVVDECAVVRMNTNKVNVQNDQISAELHGASIGAPLRKTDNDFRLCGRRTNLRNHQ